MTKLKYILLLLAAAVISNRVQAQINVSAPSVVAVDEQFNITFTLSEKASRFEWSQGDDFQLVWGPQTGSSTSISIVNGKTTKSSQYTYTYVLLPGRKGSFTLPAAHAVIGGNDVYSKPWTIEVVGNGGSSQPQAQQPQVDSQQSQAAQASSQQGSSQDLFMRLSLSRTKVVVGEPITATLKLYTRGNIAGFEDARFPTFNGFWSQEVVSPQNIEFTRENVDDKLYNAALLRQWVIIPQKAGVIEVEPAELVCLVQQRISSGNSIFDGFFDDFQTFRKRVLTPAIKVNVSQLPAGAPASFTGAVGSFKLDAKLAKDSLKVHDAASLILTVSGRGNVALAGAPKISFPPDSEVYDTKTTDKYDVGSGGTSGSKTFEYPFIPRSHGDFEIPAIEFSYYDISSRRYVTLTAGPIAYHVEPGEAQDYVSATGVNIPTNVGKDVKNLAEDIHFISVKMPQLRSEGRFFVGTALFWILIAVVLLGAAAAWFILKSIRKSRSDVALVRTKSASKVARKRLALAESYLAKNLYSAFYEELHKALLGYAGDKLNMGAADLSKETIATAFAAAGAPEGLVTEYTALLDACEYARYAPDSGNTAMKESYEKAMTVISSIDVNMKKVSSRSGASLLVALLLLMPATSIFAQSSQYVDSLWIKGVNAYTEGDFSAAREAFASIESLGLSSPELYTNLADACFKDRRNAEAILYYERALKLDPSNKDARYNIEIARALCQDRIDVVPEFFLKTGSRNLCYALSSNAWAVLGIILLALASAMVVIWLLGRRGVWRRTGFFAAIVALVLCVPCFVNASWQKNDYIRDDTAIVFRPVCSVKSAPSSTGSDLFVLHEGTKVKIMDTVGDWTNVSLSDGREGWLMTKDITII